MEPRFGKSADNLASSEERMRRERRRRRRSGAPPESGDAWIPDPADRLAPRIAEDGDTLPLYVEETAADFAVGWQGGYEIVGPAFIFITASRVA